MANYNQKWLTLGFVKNLKSIKNPPTPPPKKKKKMLIITGWR